MKRSYFLLGFLVIFFSAYSQEKPIFEQVFSKQTNIKFNNKIVETKEDNIFIYDNFYAGAGVGLGDVNNDGLLDVYFCGNQVKDKLYINKGNFVFEDITKESGIEDLDIGWSSSVSMIDINKDGLLDVFVTKELYDDKPDWRRNKLYINQGGNKFVEQAQKVGLGDTLRTRGAAFFDYDKDNDLDVFLLHQPPNPGIYSKYRALSDDGRLLDNKYAPRLYENRNGVFCDVSKEANILDPGFSNAVAVSDLNNDGYPDLVVANDFEAPDRFYLNLGNGTFKNIANDAFKHTSFYSMGVDVADINNDNFLDVFVVDMVAEDNFRLKANMSGMNPDKFWRIVDKGWNYQYMNNVLQVNNGNTTFSDIAKFSGVSNTDWSWSPLIADFDNDGLKDIIVTNGLLRDIRNTDADTKIKLFIHEKIQKYLSENTNIEGVEIWDIVSHKELSEIYPSSKLQNKAFKNIGNSEFKDVSNYWGLKNKSFSNGSAYGDLDNDGDLDLVINNINDQAFVFKNKSQNNFLRVKLKSKKNQPIFGTKVTIKYGDSESQLIEITSVRGMYSTSEHIAHFGINKISVINEVIIEWANGTRTILKNVPSNKVVETYLEEGVDSKGELIDNTNILFSDITSSSKLKHQHIENVFDDYGYQVLLPHKMSEFGPALAVSDVNNDGLDDVFVGGSTGYSATLYIQNKDGMYLKGSSVLWEKEKTYEDIDALFVDINGDGFKDLYVVSGGNEFLANDLNYEDRLYLNNGQGDFYRKPLKGLDKISGSVVKANDYDNDGDIDLFVGGRHLPHQYPLPTSSMLLKNEKGQLTNVTNSLAKELKNIGMITDAVWVDYDNDGDSDLLIVGEWMPITVFENDEGKFTRVFLNDFDNTTGLWFSIEKGDFDNDGDIDFVAGNLGLNYKYKTSKDEPFDVYYSDFDKNGNGDLVLGYYENNKHYPLRGFSCSSQQIPNLKKNIKKYDLFASLEIDDVYGKENLKNALHYTAKTFASSYIENVGNNRFKISSLPYQAQISNVNDILVNDFNNDDNLDVLIVENMYASEVETPRNDAGTGLLMLGDGKGGFLPVASRESGFFVRNDAKKVKIVNNEERLVLVANNNGLLQVIKIND
ncbi:VCBS repeat-containing protein [Jejuia spongiicola]|uniref:VCBS repeat-containing protein n=1 Tax=Jejuia spongiicola TaxID=2942207 RepID=A0ABT0QFM5_9FLAO|nr:VCBS repeat-containing protein [Jejuia spongiicola]MCL6295800.1 VCBS repeat-containing protein [Jejuia spongiicola]